MTQITQVGAELVEKHVDLAYNELGLLKEVRRFADITGLQAAGMLDRLSQIRAELDDAAVLASLDFLPDSARAVSLQPALSLQSSTEVMFLFQRANLRTSMSASESLELWLGVNPWMSRSCIGS